MLFLAERWADIVGNEVLVYTLYVLMGILFVGLVLIWVANLLIRLGINVAAVIALTLRMRDYFKDSKSDPNSSSQPKQETINELLSSEEDEISAADIIEAKVVFETTDEDILEPMDEPRKKRVAMYIDLSNVYFSLYEILVERLKIPKPSARGKSPTQILLERIAVLPSYIDIVGFLNFHIPPRVDCVFKKFFVGSQEHRYNKVVDFVDAYGLHDDLVKAGFIKSSRGLLIKGDYGIREKGVDGDLITTMIDDAVDDCYDQAILFSSDLGYIAAVDSICNRYKKEVFVIGHQNKTIDPLFKTATTFVQLSNSCIEPYIKNKNDNYLKKKKS